jgi:hypothetical protein
MLQSWPAIVFGWPAILTSLCLVVVGLLNRKAWLMAVAAGLSLLPTVYLSMYPGVFRAAWIPSILLMAAAFALHRGGRRAFPALLVLPYAGAMAWLAYVVLNQPSLT